MATDGLESQEARKLLYLGGGLIERRLGGTKSQHRLQRDIRQPAGRNPALVGVGEITNSCLTAKARGLQMESALNCDNSEAQSPRAVSWLNHGAFQILKSGVRRINGALS